MLEQLLSTGAEISVDYPDSGPGTKRLRYGDENLGYFGEVSQKDLFTLQELIEQTNVYSATSYGTFVWVKMFYKGNVIFFPLRPVASGITWNSLYEAGAVYGDDTNGKYPTTTPTKQDKILFKGFDNFRIRLFKISAADPEIISSNVTIATNSYRDEEWGSIVMALLTPRQTGYTGVNWGIYDTSVIGGPLAGNNVPSLNTQYQDNRRCCTFGPTIVTIMDKNTTGLWYPLLILDKTSVIQRPPNSVTLLSDQGGLPINYKAVGYENPLTAPIVSISNSVPPGHSIIAKDVATEHPLKAPIEIKPQMFPLPPLNVKTPTYE